MKTRFYQYFDLLRVSLQITFNSCKIVLCSMLQQSLHDERRENTGFSFQNNNDKHSEISIFAVTVGTKCQQLSNKTTKDHFSTDMFITHRK